MKIAILTTFNEFNPGYSLTGIVQDQVAMLTRYGNEVHLFVNEQYNVGNFSQPKPAFSAASGHEPGRLELRQEIPFTHLRDYSSKKDLTDEHKDIVSKTRELMIKSLQGFDAVFTHDYVFTGWNLPYCLGCVEASKGLNGLPWFHWIHSVPTSMKDWWYIREFGPQHKLIYPNFTDRVLAAEQYRGDVSHVRVLPHIKDLRSWHEFSEDTCWIIDQVPGIMQAEIVQLLPASVDRLEAKRVREVMWIFSYIKKMGRTVCLVIANQWATTRQHKETLTIYKTFANEKGLKYGEDVIFTSDLKTEWEVGVSRTVIRELFTCSNMFIFPTREESFGLVVPEAALAGVMPVLNRSLDMQREVAGNKGLYFDFGSYHRNHHVVNEENYYHDIAYVAMERYKENDSLQAKTFARQHYNWDYLYKMYYAPVLKEAQGIRLEAQEEKKAV